MKVTFEWVRGEDLGNPKVWNCYVAFELEGVNIDTEDLYLSVKELEDGTFSSSIGTCGRWGGEVYGGISETLIGAIEDAENEYITRYLWHLGVRNHNSRSMEVLVKNDDGQMDYVKYEEGK